MSQKYAILGLLNISPMTGYVIKKNLETSIKKFWPTSYGGLYPALHKMTDEGLVKVEEQNDSRGQLIYEITNTGKEELLKWLTNNTSTVQCRDEFMLKIFLSKDLANAQRVRLLEDYLYHKQKMHDELKAMIDMRDTENLYYDHGIEIVGDYTVKTLECEIDLIKNILKEEKNNGKN